MLQFTNITPAQFSAMMTLVGQWPQITLNLGQQRTAQARRDLLVIQGGRAA